MQRSLFALTATALLAPAASAADLLTYDFETSGGVQVPDIIGANGLGILNFQQDASLRARRQRR